MLQVTFLCPFLLTNPLILNSMCGDDSALVQNSFTEEKRKIMYLFFFACHLSLTHTNLSPHTQQYSVHHQELPNSICIRYSFSVKIVNYKFIFIDSFIYSYGAGQINTFINIQPLLIHNVSAKLRLQSSVEFKKTEHVLHLQFQREVCRARQHS